jgi:hypothetical protein
LEIFQFFAYFFSAAGSYSLVTLPEKKREKKEKKKEGVEYLLISIWDFLFHLVSRDPGSSLHHIQLQMVDHLAQHQTWLNVLAHLSHFCTPQ